MQTLTEEQGIVVTGFTGKAACEFSAFHKDLEQRIGRPVWTHELADKVLWREIKELYRADFITLCGG